METEKWDTEIMDWTYGRGRAGSLNYHSRRKYLFPKQRTRAGPGNRDHGAQKKHIGKTRHILDKLCGEHHQEPHKSRPRRLENIFKNQAAGNQYLLLLDEIEDPQFGSHSHARVFEASALILPRAVRQKSPRRGEASSGALHHLPTIEIANLGVAVERLKESGYTVYGADASGTPLDKVQFQFPLAVVMGNEQNGIRPHLKKNCDQLIAVPQSQIVTSLNVSNAAAIILYEIQRQAGKEEGKGMRDEG